MQPHRPQILVHIHKVLDLALTGLAFIAAYAIRKWLLAEGIGSLAVEPNYYVVLLLALLVWSQVFNEIGFYRSYRRQTLGQVYVNLGKGVGLSALILLFALYLLHQHNVSRILLAIFVVLDLALLLISKGIIYRFLHRHLSDDYNIRRVLVIGSRKLARQVIATMQGREDVGYRIIGCLDPDPAAVGNEVAAGVRVIDTSERLPRIIREQVVDEIVFAMRLKKVPDGARLVDDAETLGINVRIVPDWQIERLAREVGQPKVTVEDFLGVMTLTISNSPRSSSALYFKTIFDYLFALTTLVVLSPVMLLIGLAIKIISPGGRILFSQKRCGLNGRIFPVYKFRTMVPDAEIRLAELQAQNESDGPVFKIRKDPRIIPVIGSFLRKTSLDELPQLFNIIRGEMSLIGPRPPIPDEVEKYEPWQRRRLSMKPGITGLWQTSHNRNDVGFDEWMRLDLKYIDNWSLLLDLRIFLKTALVMMTGMGR